MSLRARSNLPSLSAVLVACFTLRYEDRLICFVYDTKRNVSDGKRNSVGTAKEEAFYV